MAQKIDRLPEGMPGLLGIVLRPEEGKQGVTAMKPAGCSESEITEEGGASGLREDGTDGVVVSRGQLQGTQGPQLNHSSYPASRTSPGGDGGGTVRRRPSPTISQPKPP